MIKIIVINLKMNFTKEEMKHYLDILKANVDEYLNLIICPSYLYLATLKDYPFKIGAQNVYYQSKGPYTGEISPSQLKSLAVEYVLLGHSERRIHFKEDDLLIAKKVKAVLDAQLKPIILIGETLDEKKDLKTALVLKNQLLIALKDIAPSDINNLMIAYEPVWAVGSGKVPSINEIEDTALYIKDIVRKNFDAEVRVLYGGSINQKNIKVINNLDNIDGLLIGSAALDANDFSSMLKSLK